MINKSNQPFQPQEDQFLKQQNQAIEMKNARTLPADKMYLSVSGVIESGQVDPIAFLSDIFPDRIASKIQKKSNRIESHQIKSKRPRLAAIASKWGQFTTLLPLLFDGLRFDADSQPIFCMNNFAVSPPPWVLKFISGSLLSKCEDEESLQVSYLIVQGKDWKQEGVSPVGATLYRRRAPANSTSSLRIVSGYYSKLMDYSELIDHSTL